MHRARALLRVHRARALLRGCTRGQRPAGHRGVASSGTRAPGRTDPRPLAPPGNVKLAILFYFGPPCVELVILFYRPLGRVVVHGGGGVGSRRWSPEGNSVGGAKVWGYLGFVL